MQLAEQWGYKSGQRGAGALDVYEAPAWISPVRSQAAYTCLLVFDCLRFSEFD